MMRNSDSGALRILYFLLLTSLLLAACNRGSDSQSRKAGLNQDSPKGAALVVDTRYGTIKGAEWDENTFSWLGVPYAKPPVGSLRWKAPQEPDPWPGALVTDTFSSECMQLGGLLLDLDPATFGQPMGSEDCLYLNLWRPQTDEDNLPVFFYVHGGMNIVGEGATSLYHGANLAHKGNMMVVTINYRLGPLGSFTHPALKSGDPLDDSGNYGLLDIIQALRWIQDNVKAFGGDPDNVTLAGESAGGADVISLLSSPVAHGLFHRAISMSPASTDSAASMDNTHQVTAGILLNLLINNGLANNIFEALRLVEERDDSWVRNYLLSADGSDLLNACTPFSAMGINGLGLLLEPLLSSRIQDGTVITADYPALFTAGDYNQVPIIIGSNMDEMKIFELAFGIITSLDEGELCDLVMTFDPDNPEMSASDFVPLNLQPIYTIIGKIGGDFLFEGSGVRPLVEKTRKHQNVYVYKFAWDDQPAPMDFLVGASHMMELPFMFSNFHTDPGSFLRFSFSEENRPDRETLSDAMITYWSNFARTGDPNAGAVTGLAYWEPCSSTEPGSKHIIFDTNISMSQ